jgi:hypothetical protein
MAFCGKCGAQLHEGATFCANCGAATSAAAQPPAAGTPVVTHPGIAGGVPPQRGFWGSLFDLSFTSFVTVKVVKFLFVLGIICVVIGAIYVMVSAGNIPGLQTPTAVIVIAVPILAFLYILLIRIYLEILTVTFRGVEYLRELVEQGRSRG